MKKINLIGLFILLIAYAQSIGQNCVQCAGTTADGETASAIGINNIAHGKASFTGGLDCEAIDKYTLAFGDSAKAWSRNAIALGKHVSVFGPYSFGIGENVKTTITSSMVIGSGFNDYHPLTNNIGKSLMIGFNSEKPTLFIGPSSGLGLTGKVAIGNITSPTAKLHIKADDNEHADLLLDPSGSYSAKIKFGETAPNTSPNRVEARADSDLNFYTASDFVFWNANMGIGINNPHEKLEVNGNIKQSMGYYLQTDKVKASGETGLKLHDETGSGPIVKNGGKLGINQPNPSYDLDVNGTVSTSGFRFNNGSVTNGYVLQTDASGVASWVDPLTLNVDDGDWDINGNNIFHQYGLVGIGTVDPVEALQIGDRWTFHNGGNKIIGYNYD